MIKSEMQHQFWITKKAVQRKLGSKEDQCVVSSDAELDAKIELFTSISESCSSLYRILDQYQERLYILSQEENALGKFLKESGKRSKTTGKNMMNAGKAISYSGQQRMTVRPPLLRLHHEVEVFQCRAVGDTQATINCMEKGRTEYRAALSWMKSASSQLDPDTGRGLDKFRKSQNHVRIAKTKFDRLSMDCIQKIDLLAAARCNMFSHALVAYMHGLLQFSKKTCETYKTISENLSIQPKYDFCILKDLAQSDEPTDVTLNAATSDKSLDGDQFLFFADDYSDVDKNKENNGTSSAKEEQIIANIDERTQLTQTPNKSNANGSYTLNILDNLDKWELSEEKLFSLEPASTDLLSSDKETNQSLSPMDKLVAESVPSNKPSTDKPIERKKTPSSWLQLFSELDPLANPDAFARKIDGGKENSQNV